MRITNKMIARNMLSTIERNRQMASELQLDIATTKKVRRPSDDPSGVLQIEKFNALISRNEQFLRNMTQIRGFITNSTTALDAINDDLETARDLAIQGASDTLTAEARQSLANHIDQIINNLVDLGNSGYKGRSIFAGTITTGVTPFTRTGDIVTYNGNNEEINGSIGFDTQVAYNKTGTDIFNPTGGTDIFSELIALKQGLENNDTNAIQNAVGTLESALKQINSGAAELGALHERLNAAEQIIQNENINLVEYISNIQDTDMVEAIVNSQIIENAVTTSLRAMADIVQTSLVDFVS